VREDVRATRLAARIGDLAKYPDGREQEKHVALARRDSDFAEYINLSMFPGEMQRIRNSRLPENETICTMCGDFCAMQRGFSLFKDDIAADKLRPICARKE
jgi:thiamine biosynthesis protein ThiC